MDSFVDLFVALAKRAGVDDSSIFFTKATLPLPGFFRATKEWDLLIVLDGRLVAALELKSQVGSFGNNFNNRTEEAMGSALDLWTAYREGNIPASSTPFLGWMMLLENSPASNKPVRTVEPHFPVRPEFHSASYTKRYELFCKKLVLERHYTAAALLTSAQDSGKRGVYAEPSMDIGIRRFASGFIEHIRAAIATHD